VHQDATAELKDLQRVREQHEREREQRELPELIAVDLECRAGA
jgi:hypothetical protein